MKNNPLTWFFTRPQGKLGRKVMGYYWRMVVLGLIGLFVVFPHLIATYPETYLPTAVARETPWPIIAFVHMVFWAFVCFIVSIPLQIVRFIAWLITGPSAEELQEIHEFQQQEEIKRKLRHEANLAHERSVNHIRLSQEDSDKVKRIRSLARDLYLLAAVLGVSVSVLALGVLPGYLKEAPQPWSVFAEIIQILPFHMVILGFLVFLVLSGMIAAYFSRKEKEIVRGKYLWKDDVENRITLHE